MFFFLGQKCAGALMLTFILEVEVYSDVEF